MKKCSRMSSTAVVISTLRVYKHFYAVMRLQDADVMANNVDDDQTAPWIVLSGAALFAQTCLS